MMKLKARLTKAYGSEDGFLRHQMDLEDVQRKLELCEEVMAVVGALDPGQTDWRGSLLYEKNWPAMTLLQYQYSKHTISKKIFKKSIKNLLGQLETAKRSLDIEDTDSFEKQISQKIGLAIRSMENMIK